MFYQSMHPDPDPPTDGSLWVIDTDGADPHPITSDTSRPADWARWSPDGTRIVWSPDGTEIVFAMGQSNDEFAHQPNRIYVISATGNDLRLVSASPDFKHELYWVL